MIDLTDAMRALSPRELRLIGVFAGIVAPLAAIFLVLVPMVEGQRAAERELDSKRAQLRWVEAQARLHPPVMDISGPSRSDGGGLSALEQSLVAADLRRLVSALTNRRDGAVELRFDRIAFGALMPWLAQVARDIGYSPAAFTVEATSSPGIVAATLILEASG